MSSVLDAGQVRYVRMARYAIALALHTIGIKRGEQILIPAYHCSSMVAPVVDCGAEPVFYRIREDLTAEIDDLKSKIGSQTRAIIAPHYFGFHQSIARLRDICDRRGLVLIEDCAHAFFGEVDGRPIGSFGDFAVASLWKFFPVPEGGCLVSARYPLNLDLAHKDGRVGNLRAFLQMLDQANYYGRLKVLQPLAMLVSLASALRNGLRGTGANATPPRQPNHRSAGTDSEFDPSKVNDALGALLQRVAKAGVRRGRAIAALRRRNYAVLHDRFERLEGCRPLVAKLPEVVVPFMFPLWIDDLTRVHPRLEDAAVPMQRFGQFLWTGVNERTCPISYGFSKSLVQVPCHEGLDIQELDWIAERVRESLTAR